MTKKQVLFDLTIAGVMVYGIYKTIEHFDKKKKYSEVSTPKYATASYDKEKTENQEVKDEEPKTDEKEATGLKETIVTNSKKVAAKIKKAASKVVDFIVEHQVEIEAITSALSFVAAAFTAKSSFDNAMKKSNSSKTQSPRVVPEVVNQYVDEDGVVRQGLKYTSLDIDEFVQKIGEADGGRIYNKGLGDKYIEYRTCPIYEEKAA